MYYVCVYVCICMYVCKYCIKREGGTNKKAWFFYKYMIKKNRVSSTRECTPPLVQFSGVFNPQVAGGPHFFLGAAVGIGLGG